MSDTPTTLRIDGAPEIPGLRFRRPRRDPADYAAIAALIGAAHAEDGAPSRPTARQIQDEMEVSTSLDITRDVILAEIEGRVVAEAELERVVRDGVVVFQTAGSVLPAWRRQGFGRALLRANIRRAAERAAQEPAGQTTALGGWADDSEVGHRTILVAEGFEPTRFFFLMRRDLTQPIPDLPLPGGLELRPVTPDHYRTVFDAEVEAFRDHWGARVKTDEDFALTYGREELDPSLWVVAWDGDQVAGVVQNWIWTAENEELGIARGWLEHISVRRPWRRRGLARAITAASLLRLRSAGMTEGMLGVDSENPTGALGLYEGLGFEVFARSTAYRRDIVRP